MGLNTFLGRALTDPATGLPNEPYFALIRDYELRRARRRDTHLCILSVEVSGGGERVRRSLSWRLCQELRGSDLIASEGRERFHILLTSPDAENAETLRERLAVIASELTRVNPADPPLELRVSVEEMAGAGVSDSPCTPCDERELAISREDAHADARDNANLDPITNDPGAHPVGTGAGAASGGAAGAAIGGLMGGPLGAFIGAAVGAMAGGMAGKEVAEVVNPTEEEAYWELEYPNRPYAKADRGFSEYRPAYRLGCDARCREKGRRWDDVEPELAAQWGAAHGESGLPWEEARLAARDAWDHVDRRIAERRTEE